jgi:UDP-N-acetylmuramate-alanine ligase
VALASGMDIDVALTALQAYRGSSRRFEWKGEARGVTVIDDYAHHPTEIQATLAAARQRFPLQRIWAVFQPHTFSRTQRMLYRMGESFEQANAVIVLDIYAAREVDDGSVQRRGAGRQQPAPGDSPHPTLVEAARYLAQHADARRRGDHPGRGRRLSRGRAAAGATGWEGDGMSTAATLLDLRPPAAFGVEIQQQVTWRPTPR